ncbi:MAG: rhomboid family intramembrane serine protease [Solirubrobacterales bacterium]
MPTARFPLITVVLIAINIVVFGWQLGHPDDQASNPTLAQAQISERDQVNIEFGAIPAEVTSPGTYCAPLGDDQTADVCGERADFASDGRFGELGLQQAPWWVTLATSMFMHGGFLHIIGNMLFLWVFGNNVEDSMGRGRFVAFYLLAGLAAVYTQSAINPDSTVPTIGASGAVAGVLGAYLLLHPKARVLTLVFIIFFVTVIELPALLLLGIWFVLQFLPAVGQLSGPESGGGVAYLAHVGGFAFGLLTIHAFARFRNERQDEPRIPVY